MTAGKKYLQLMAFDEALVLPAGADLDEAKDGKMFPKRPEEPWGKGDKLSTPQKDVKAKPEEYPAEALSDGEVGLLMIALAGAGILSSSPGAATLPGSVATWRCPSYAYEKLVSILAGAGLVPSEPPAEGSFGADKTSLSVAVSKHNVADYDQDSNPIPTGVSVTLTWTATQPGQFTVAADIKGPAQPAEGE
jgi:hypothetical protein